MNGEHLPTRNQTESNVANVIASECLAVRVRLLNRAVTGIYDDALRPLGMTVSQLNVLVGSRSGSKSTAGSFCRLRPTPLSMRKAMFRVTP